MAELPTLNPLGQWIFMDFPKNAKALPIHKGNVGVELWLLVLTEGAASDACTWFFSCNFWDAPWCSEFSPPENWRNHLFEVKMINQDRSRIYQDTAIELKGHQAKAGCASARISRVGKTSLFAYLSDVSAEMTMKFPDT